MVDVLSEVEVFDLAGKSLGKVEAARQRHGRRLHRRPETTKKRSSYSPATTCRPSVYRYDVPADKTKLVRQPKVKFNPADFAVEQVFYKSKDGTRVPMMLAYRKDLPKDRPHPTLLYGYGGYNISMVPAFKPEYIGWMELGGVLAVANMRGGGEYGEEWHLAGKTVKKQNVFDDFIAAAEWLIREKRTTRDKLAIMGGSNGGLLVGAVEVQRPDLFGACIPMVGVLDMLRFQEFTAGQFWRDEYGYIEKEDEFKALLAYSPYHNIKKGTSYPPTLIMTADTDDRVVPMHSFKFGAAMQRAQSWRCADPAAHRNPSRPRRRHAGQEADRKRGRPLGVLGERAADGNRERTLIDRSVVADAYFATVRLRNSRGSGNETFSCRIERGSTTAPNRSRSQSRH